LRYFRIELIDLGFIEVIDCKIDKIISYENKIKNKAEYACINYFAFCSRDVIISRLNIQK